MGLFKKSYRFVTYNDKVASQIQKITDQKRLMEIAIEAKDILVVEEALNHITDDYYLYEIYQSKYTSNINTKEKALDRIKDQEIFKKDGKVDSNDVLYIRKIEKNNKNLDMFQRIVGDVNRDGKVDNSDASALDDILKTGKMNISKGDVNGDGMITAADALLIRDHMQSNVILNDSQLSVADINNDKAVNKGDMDKIIDRYLSYLKSVK